MRQATICSVAGTTAHPTSQLSKETSVEYDVAKGKTRVSPYNIMRMPIDYLTEYN